MAFADLNSDKYTDVITADALFQQLFLYAFDEHRLQFKLWKSITPTRCTRITNVAVGLSTDATRLFITCTDTQSRTVVASYDIEENEIEEKSQVVEI
jgi:hypothetical protein